MIGLFDDDDDLFGDDLPVRTRTFKPRTSFDAMSDAYVVEHFRLPPEAIEMLARRIGPTLQPKYAARSTDLGVIDTILIALSYYATGDHFRNIGQARGVRHETVSRAVDRVTDALLAIGNDFIRLPDADEAREIKNGFYEVSCNAFRSCV